MRPHTPLTAIGLAAAMALALTGCVSLLPLAPAGQETSAPLVEETAAPANQSTLPPISAPPATGELITGTGYSFHAPAGWSTPPDAPSRADAYLISAKANAKGVYDTVNVLFQPATADTPDEIELNGVGYLEAVIGATHVQVRPRVAIAGAECVHISSLRTTQGITAWSEQYIVTSSGITYTITFAFDKAESQADRDALAESLLASWSWA